MKGGVVRRAWSGAIASTLGLLVIATAAHAVGTWGAVLQGLFAEAAKEFAVDSSKELAKVFVGKLNSWLEDERALSPETIKGGELKQGTGDSVREWSAETDKLSREEVVVLAEFLSKIDGGRTQEFLRMVPGDSTQQVIIGSPGSVQIKGDDNHVTINRD